MENTEMDTKSKSESELDTESEAQSAPASAPRPAPDLMPQPASAPQPPSDPIPQPASAPALELRAVSVRLGGRQILDQVSFRIAPGEFTGLIGSNGAGKTTMLRIILGLRAADAGDVLVDGRSSGGVGRRRAGGLRIGYVPQKIQLEPDAPLRARDLVALGLDGGRLGPRLPSRGRRETVERMLASVGATAFADERVGTLSGGEQQRILIAHALISRPRLLLMDEPLANLDLRSGQEVVELVSQVAREHAVAVLLSAHDINPLLPVMDKVVYLAEGRAAAGTTEQVVRSDVLSGLYQHPISVLRVDGRILVVAGSTVTADAFAATGSGAGR
jgi:zinc/manganese transport system ATP-binding protein